jgi:hypothetical protein
MKKIAIFVEGQTEYDFIKRLLFEVVGKENISIIANRMFGGNNKVENPRHPKPHDEHLITDAPFQASFFISSGDNKVTSDIQEEKERLGNLGFSKIIGLRDLRGDQNKRKLTHADLPAIENLHRFIERNISTPTKIITAVMEIETWFLAETNHYVCVDDRLTTELIDSKTSELGFNPYFDDLTFRTEPTEDLHNLYKLVGRQYSKKKGNKTINCLDINHLREIVGQKIVPVKELFEHIEKFVK